MGAVALTAGPLGACFSAPPTGDEGRTDQAVKTHAKKTCASVGGTCVPLVPSACKADQWADGPNVTCGDALGVGCCLERACPELTPPAPTFCPGGKVVPVTNDAGCTVGYDCVAPTCPEIVRPAPTFCPNGKLVPVKNDAGCTVGYDCRAS